MIIHMDVSWQTFQAFQTIQLIFLIVQSGGSHVKNYVLWTEDSLILTVMKRPGAKFPTYKISGWNLISFQHCYSELE